MSAQTPQLSLSQLMCVVQNAGDAHARPRNQRKHGLWLRWPAISNLRESNGAARVAESFFFPLDEKLEVGTEGYSPQVLKKAVRQASKATSFADASDDLRELANISISATHLERLCERIGSEWAKVRDAEIVSFQERKLPCTVSHTSPVSAVMLDGGRVRIRADEQPRGVHGHRWHETKVACCLGLSNRVHAEDPQPEPPSKLLDPPQVVRLAAELKARGGATNVKQCRGAKADKKPRKPRRKRRRPRGMTKRLRTVVATTLESESFGWQVAAEVQRRGLDRADRKACVCDGQKYNWTIFELHLLPLGFVAILDFLHLVVYLYAASHAVRSKGTLAAWELYERWVRWAWSGRVEQLIAALREASERLGPPPSNAAEDDPRAIVAEALHYVENNRARMDYPRYRRLGLPTSSAPVESLIKQLNRRVKGSEKFWLCGGAEKILQVRAAYLSEDGRAERLWSRPRPRCRCAGQHRLGRAA
jgi:hypothetical protein